VRDLAAESGIDGNAATGWIAWARLDCPRWEISDIQIPHSE
jgi:hypothetical protein